MLYLIGQFKLLRKGFLAKVNVCCSTVVILMCYQFFMRGMLFYDGFIGNSSHLHIGMINFMSYALYVPVFITD